MARLHQHCEIGPQHRAPSSPISAHFEGHPKGEPDFVIHHCTAGAATPRSVLSAPLPAKQDLILLVILHLLSLDLKARQELIGTCIGEITMPGRTRQCF